MMTKTYKLRELSDLFCDADGVRDQEERDRRYSQMRLLSQKKLIQPDSDDISRGKVARYSIGEACIARLIFRLYKIGISTKLLKDVADNLRRRPTKPSFSRDVSSEKERDTGKKVGPATFETVLAAIESGERWILEVTLKRKDGGRQWATARFRPTDIATPDLFGKPTADPRGDAIILQATDLLSPVIKAVPEG